MSYSYPLAMPSTPGVRDYKLTLVRKQAKTESPFTGQRQVTAFDGAWWELELEYPPMTETQAREWIVFLAKLQGQVGTFYWSDPDNSLVGAGGGTPVVDGDFASNKVECNVSGYPASTLVLTAGDYIQFSNYELKRIVEDATTTGSSVVTVKFEPRIRNEPGHGTTVTDASTKGKFKLISSDISWNVSTMMQYGIRFAAREDVI